MRVPMWYGLWRVAGMIVLSGAYFSPFKAKLGLLPFYHKSSDITAFTVLREKRRTFTLPPPYVRPPGASLVLAAADLLINL